MVPPRTLVYQSLISIHALLAESDMYCGASPDWRRIFLSTLSSRRATSALQITRSPMKFLSTLSSRRATRAIMLIKLTVKISIHALLAESDQPARPNGWSLPKFLSTLSSRRATPRSSRASSSLTYFYPRSPRGERQQKATKDRFFCCRTCYITITIRAFSRFVKIFSPL